MASYLERLQQAQQQGPQTPNAGAPVAAPPQSAPETGVPVPTPPRGGYASFDPSMVEQVSEAPTMPQAPPSIDPDMVLPEKDSAFSMSQVAGQAYRHATRTMPAAVMLRAMGDSLAEHGSTSGTEAFLGAAADVGNAGTFDRIAAFDYAMREKADGNEEEFSQIAAERQQAINEGLALNQTDHPVASVFGSMTGGVVGMIAPGTVAMNSITATKTGAQVASNYFTRSLLLAPLAGGSQAALYRYNSDGTTEEVLADATYGAVGGALFAGAGGVIGGFARRLMGKNVSGHEKLAAAELMKGFRARSNGEIIPPDIVARMEAEGAESVVSDLYPGMGQLVRDVMHDPDTSAGARQLAGILHARNAVEIDFPDAVTDAMLLPRPRTLEEFKTFSSARQNRLQPRYDAVLDSSNMRFKPSGVFTAIERTIADTGNGSERYMREALEEVQDLLAQNGLEGAEDRMSMRGLHNVSSALSRNIREIRRGNQMARTPVGGQARLNTRSTESAEGLQIALNKIQETLAGASDEYAGLQRTYGRVAQQNQAFKNGYEAFSSTATDGVAIENLVESMSNRAQITAFAQGAQRHLYENILKQETPQALERYLVNNSRRMGTVRALLGPERADEIVQAAIRAASRQRTADSIQSGLDDLTPNPMPDNTVRRNAADAMIATQNVGGGQSSAAPVRALSNFLGLGKASPEQQTAVRDVYGAALGAPANQLPQVIEQTARQAAGITPQTTALGKRAVLAGAAGGIGLPEVVDDAAQSESLAQGKAAMLSAMEAYRNRGNR